MLSSRSVSWHWRRGVPKRDDPRVVVRMSPEDHELLSALAKSANVSLGGLIRETAVKFAASIARDARRGDITIRRAKAVEAVRGQVVPASAIVRSPAEEWARERQRKLNEQRDRKAAKPRVRPT